MPQRYWDPELETAPWQEVLSWQAARAVPFVRALPNRSAFHRALLGRTRLPERAAGLRVPGRPPLHHQGRDPPLAGRTAARRAVRAASGRAAVRGSPDHFLLGDHRRAGHLRADRRRPGGLAGRDRGGLLHRGDPPRRCGRAPGRAAGRGRRAAVRRRLPAHRRDARVDRRAPDRADHRAHPALAGYGGARDHLVRHLSGGPLPGPDRPGCLRARGAHAARRRRAWPGPAGDPRPDHPGLGPRPRL